MASQPMPRGGDCGIWLCGIWLKPIAKLDKWINNVSFNVEMRYCEYLDRWVSLIYSKVAAQSTGEILRLSINLILMRMGATFTHP